MRTIIIFIILCCFSLLGAQQDFVRKEIVPRKIEKPIKVDGNLDEPVWTDAEVAKDFIQFQPHRGAKATFKTEVRILLSETHLYFGVTCFDPEPDKIIARLTKRDSELDEDDSIGIGLDTFLDRRTAYYFFTNPLGTQLDGRLSDNGRTGDSTWDGEWQCAAKTTAAGWQAEVAIPLVLLKYKPGENQSWGFGLTRAVPRILERTTWTGPTEDVGRVSLWGTLSGMTLARASKKWMVVPHVITRVQEKEDSFVTGGIDARYAFSQSVSADLTVNPDFATVEADQEQINLTRFELSLSEKRKFFLEGSEIYSQRIRLFYSRRISDIYGGTKVYGKAGGYEFSAMTVQSKADDDLDLDGANYSVVRVRKDVFKSSTIGFLAANKMVGKKNYGNIGLDVVHFFSEKVNFTGQLALSYGDFGSDNIAFFLRPSYDSSTFHIHLRYTQLGENFADNANAVGFVQDDNRNEFDSAVEKIWWIKKHGIDRIEYGSNYNIYWSKDWELRSWQIDQDLEFDFTNKFSFELSYQNEYKLYEKKFYNYQVELQLGYNTREWQSARINYEFGRSFDSRFRIYGVGVNYKLLKTLSLEYDLNRLTLDPDPENESTWLHVVRLTNYFTRDLYLKLFYQTHTAISKYNVQALFVYRFKPPFGTIQLAYQKGTSRFGEAGNQGHTLFVKLSTVL